jgi:GAF domain-containing protein
MEQIENTLVRCAAESLMLGDVALRLLDEDGETLQVKAAFGPGAAVLSLEPVKLSESPLDAEVMTGRVVLLTRADEEDRRILEGTGCASMLCVPVSAGDRIIGILTACSRERMDFTMDDIRKAATIATQGGTALRNARHYQKITALLDITSSIAASLKTDQVLELITRYAVETISVKGSIIMLMDDERRKLQLRASYGVDERYRRLLELDVNNKLLEALKGELVIIRDAKTDPIVRHRRIAKAAGVSTIVSLPMIARGTIMGILLIFSSTVREFPQDQIEYLQILAKSGAVALENARLFEFVTGEYNSLTRNIWKWYEWGEKPAMALAGSFQESMLDQD